MGAEITFGASVESVTPGDPKPSITLSTGELIVADVVIGADGPNSRVRQGVISEEHEPEPSGYTTLGGIVYSSELLKDPVLAQWAKAEKVSVIEEKCILVFHDYAVAYFHGQRS